MSIQFESEEVKNKYYRAVKRSCIDSKPGESYLIGWRFYGEQLDKKRRHELPGFIREIVRECNKKALLSISPDGVIINFGA